VAVAVQRLREAPPDPRQDPRDPRLDPRDPRDPRAQRGRQQPARNGGLSALNALVWGVAGAAAPGAGAVSVKNAEAQKFPGYTMLWLTGLPAGHPANVIPTQASLGVTNHQGVAEQYELRFLTKGKVTSTWKFTLSDGQSWVQTVAYTANYTQS